jgi:excisionase family DNA binding protein
VRKIKSLSEARKEKTLSEMRQFIDEVMSQADPEKAVSDTVLDKKSDELTEKWNKCKGGVSMDKIFTPKEVAEYLKIKEKTVKDYLREGKLGGFKTGKEWRVRERDIIMFMESGGVKAEYKKAD